MTAALVIDQVSKRFPAPKGGEDVCALKDLSFEMGEGEFTCLLGRSGCGKSTLLSLAAGLSRPDSGRLLCKGAPIIGPDRHRMLMFQDAALFPWLDVLDNVLYGLSFVEGLNRAEKLDRANAFLEMVGLRDFRHFRIHELSGGMRQRVALARALSPDPDLLLMDEPFSALDAMTREQLYADVQQIWLKTQKTILMVTHNVREAVCLGSRIIILAARGQLVADEQVGLPYPRSMNDTALAVKAAHISRFLQNGDDTGAAKSDSQRLNRPEALVEDDSSSNGRQTA
jgi:NitT/TauT family transport system ATP-binding protein